jgi:hypothetical protein
MWAVIGVLLLAFALGWLLPDARALWAPALLGTAAAVVILTTGDLDAHWSYGLVLGAGIAVGIGVVVLLGVAVRRSVGRSRGQGWLDL